jgi:uncharacterized delta-60 repeat protein
MQRRVISTSRSGSTTTEAWTPWAPGITRVDVDAPYDYVNAHGLAVQADGKILAVFGEGSEVFRFSAAGLLDPDFGSHPYLLGRVIVGPFYELRDVAVQEDGGIVAAGLHHLFPVRGDNGALVRLLDDGTPDPSFGIGGFIDPPGARAEELHSVTIRSDGKIVAAGRVRAKRDRFVVRRLLSNGSSDSDFGARGKVRSKPDRNVCAPGNTMPTIGAPRCAPLSQRWSS